MIRAICPWCGKTELVKEDQLPKSCPYCKEVGTVNTMRRYTGVKELDTDYLPIHEVMNVR